MSFRQAVAATPGLSSHYQPGIQALRPEDRHRLRSSDARRLRGSMDVDTALRRSRPQDARWDYAIGIARRSHGDLVLWLEVHSASSLHNITEVLRKLEWLKGWLHTDAPALRSLPGRFLWLASGTVAFRSGSPQMIKIAQRGLRFCARQFDLDRID